MKSKNPIPERIWDDHHFSRSLELGPNLYFVFRSFSPTLKVQHKGCNSVSYENKERGYRAPLTEQMVLDLERQHYEKIRREQKERIVIDGVIAKYGYIPEWILPHLPPELRSISDRLETISNDLGEVRKIMEDPVTC